MVGDDAQSIYSWRGANIGNMLDFQKDYPKHKIFRLEQNYRSTKNILKAADSVIKNNKLRSLKHYGLKIMTASCLHLLNVLMKKMKLTR